MTMLKHAFADSGLADILSVAEALCRAETVEEVIRVALDQGGALVGASGGVLMLVSPDGSELVVSDVTGSSHHAYGACSSIAFTQRLPASSAACTGKPVFFEHRAKGEDEVPPSTSLRGSTAALPLLAGTRVFGVLEFLFDRKRVFAPGARELMRLLAAQCSQSLARAKHQRQNREATEARKEREL